MPLSTMELADARDAVAEILDYAGLEDYVFEVESHQGQWELRLECATEDSWQTLTLPVDKDLLLASRKEEDARIELLSQWRPLWSCKLASSD